MALGCTVRELLARIDSRELAEWMAYYRFEPWGGGADDYRAGVVAATIANVRLAKGRKPFKPGDFMPKRGPARRQSVVEMQMRLRAFTDAHNARR